MCSLELKQYVDSFRVKQNSLILIVRRKINRRLPRLLKEFYKTERVQENRANLLSHSFLTPLDEYKVYGIRHVSCSTHNQLGLNQWGDRPLYKQILTIWSVLSSALEMSDEAYIKQRTLLVYYLQSLKEVTKGKNSKVRVI